MLLARVLAAVFSLSTLHTASGATVTPTCNSANGDYPHSVNIGGVDLQYRLEENKLVAKAVFNAAWKGWVSVGFCEQGDAMYPADAFIGFVETGKVAEYSMQGMSDAAVTPKPDQSKLQSTLMALEGGRTVMYFTRLFPSANKDNYITTSQPANLIWAAGDSGLGYHGTNRGDAIANLGACPMSLNSGASANSLSANPPAPAATSEAVAAPSGGATGAQCSSDDPLYPFSFPLNNDLRVYFRMEGATVAFKAVLNRAVTGWFSLGMAENPNQMYDARAFMGTVKDSSVTEYDLKGMSVSDVVPSANQNALSDGAFSVQNGKTVLSFGRSLAGDNAYINVMGGPTNFIWASGSSQTIGYHGPDRGYKSFTLTSCTSAFPTPAPAPSTSSPPSSTTGTTTTSGSGSVFGSGSGSASTDTLVGSGACNANLGLGYPSQVSLATGMAIGWELKDNRLSMQVVHDGTAGWLAVGFSSQADRMAPSMAMIGQSDGSVYEYDITSYDMSGVTKKTDQNSLVSGNMTVAGGKTSLFFTRTVAENDKSNIKLAGDTYLIWAYGSGSLAYHGRNKGGSTVNLATCSTAVGSDPDKTVRLYMAHGALMFAAWAVLSPTAIIVARLKALFTDWFSVPILWFKMHWVIQLTAVALSTAGLIVATQVSTHFRPIAHTYMGCVVLGMTFAQPLLSVKRPHPKEPDGTVSTARKIWAFIHKNNGRCAVLMAFVVIGLGLKAADAEPIIFILYYVWCGVVVVAYLLSSFIAYRHENAKPPPSPMSSANIGRGNSIPMVSTIETAPSAMTRNDNKK